MSQSLQYASRTQAQPAGASLAASSRLRGEEVQTRFGGYRVDPKQRLDTPRGLPGFPEERRFALLELPDQRMGSFRLLQSLDNSQLSFIVAPVPDPKMVYDAREMEEILQAARVPAEDLLLLAIVTIRPAEEGGGVALSVNLRAPLMVDSLHREARQHVLSATKLPVRQPFTGWDTIVAERNLV